MVVRFFKAILCFQGWSSQEESEAETQNYCMDNFIVSCVIQLSMMVFLKIPVMFQYY